MAKKYENSGCGMKDSSAAQTGYKASTICYSAVL